MQRKHKNEKKKSILKKTGYTLGAIGGALVLEDLMIAPVLERPSFLKTMANMGHVRAGYVPLRVEENSLILSKMNSLSRNIRGLAQRARDSLFISRDEDMMRAMNPLFHVQRRPLNRTHNLLQAIEMIQRERFRFDYALHQEDVLSILEENLGVRNTVFHDPRHQQIYDETVHEMQRSFVLQDATIRNLYIRNQRTGDRVLPMDTIFSNTSALRQLQTDVVNRPYVYPEADLPRPVWFPQGIQPPYIGFPVARLNDLRIDYQQYHSFAGVLQRVDPNVTHYGLLSLTLGGILAYAVYEEKQKNKDKKYRYQTSSRKNP